MIEEGDDLDGIYMNLFCFIDNLASNSTLLATMKFAFMELLVRYHPLDQDLSILKVPLKL
jgi:hypothetical protein